MRYVLIVQLTTYVALGFLFIGKGRWDLAAAQFLLTGVQGLLFKDAF